MRFAIWLKRAGGEVRVESVNEGMARGLGSSLFLTYLVATARTGIRVE